MASNKIIMKVSIAWWFRYYVAGVAAMCKLTGLEPDHEKLAKYAALATRIKVVK